jgi:hypothetical protein
MEVESADALAALALTDEERLVWAEHANRLHVFRLFQYAGDIVGGVRDRRLGDLVGCTPQAQAFDRVWITEGIGYLRGSGIRDESGVPERSLIPLHAGAGLFMAVRWLLHAHPCDTDMLVDGFVAECRDVSRAGFDRVTFEAMGLAVATVQPARAASIDASLARRDPILRACFWHGYGRGCYFSVTNWETVGEVPMRAAALMCRQATTTAGARNAIAGFIWAVTLVNLQMPEVIERYVAALAHDLDADALANGIESSLIVWQHAAPDDDALVRVLQYKPGLIASFRDWDRIVHRPARAACDRHRACVRDGRIQDVFHFGPV